MDAAAKTHQPKVMVIDDDENILSAFEGFLKKEHCNMIRATSAEEGLAKFEQQHIDLLITDIRLRFQSGVTFFLSVKTSHPKLPVIVVTGFPDLVTEEELKSYGADYYFLKPLELEKLRDAVRKCLRPESKRSSNTNYSSNHMQKEIL